MTLYSHQGVPDASKMKPVVRVHQRHKKGLIA